LIHYEFEEGEKEREKEREKEKESLLYQGKIVTFTKIQTDF